MSVNRLVNFFEIIAFGSEFEDIGKTPFVRKWKSKSTLTYKISGNRKSIETFRPVIEKHAKALSFDTGLKFREIGARGPAGYLIFWFAESDKMVEAGLMIKKTLGLFAKWRAMHGVISWPTACRMASTSSR